MTEHSKPPKIRLRPLPEAREQLPVSIVLETAVLPRLQKGFFPQSTEDKWLIHLQKNLLFFHRAATGVCVFVVRLLPTTEGLEVAEAWANRDPREYKNSDSGYDGRLLVYLMRKLLLGHNVPFPVPTDLPYQNTAEHEQHVMGKKAEAEQSFIPLNLFGGDDDNQGPEA